MLLLRNSQLSALDFFDHVDSSYGIDHDGPVFPEDNGGGVEVPLSTLLFFRQ